ncbi:TonB-dependent siderophore receptor [Halarcobacter mediterraneus]|uniref:TonB-dependent siderophore receptor n=1 Tax=Halarcobacter mediterraneus TaxID=2023153 RepID=A0A4Q1AY40_9BACT|nr:TonB-dependent receptor [Halarcobacter mediterraneus]RXK13280.1 TonB-dependent siderophore receptor [Halarcobacter mediterraneus]
MNNKLLKLALISLVTNSLLFAGKKEPIKLNEITVSANKIDENIKDVPQSISVLDEYTIEEKGIRNIKDVISNIPNMSTKPFDGTYVNFRGLNSSTFTNNNPIVIYIDGIPQTDRYGFDASLANIERVEVLRGPQSTLYGKDAIGGVINIITKEPTNEWSGNLGLEYGSEEHIFSTFNLNGALIDDKLFLGINGQLLQDEGWITNNYQGKNEEDVNSQRDRKINTYLLYKPTDNLTTKFTISKDYFKTNWFDGKNYLDPMTATRDDAKNVSFDVPTYTKTDSFSQSLLLKYELDNLEFNSITTHKKTDTLSHIDQDFSDSLAYKDLIMFGDTTNKSLSQEFRLSGKTENNTKWIAGLFLEKEDIDKGPFGEQFPAMENTEANFMSDNTAKTGAIFGQVMIPFLEDFEVTVGGRYQRITKEINMNAFYKGLNSGQYYSNDFSNTYSSPTAFLTQEGKKTSNVFLPKFALSYKINPTWTTYTSISKGYMPGGFNYIAFSGTAHENSFEAQTSVNYEVGVKAEFDKAILAASIFYMDIKDIHVYKNVGNGMYVTSNAKKAHSQGFEIQGRYFLTDNLDISASLGIISAKYDDFDNGTTNYDNKRIEKTPSKTATLSLSYIHPNGFYGRIDSFYQGTTVYYDQSSNWSAQTDDYFTTNVKLGYRFSDFDTYIYAKNITDEEYISNIEQAHNVVFGDARQIGIGIKYTF